MLLGLLEIVFAYGRQRDLKQSTGTKIAAALVALSGLGMISIGLFIGRPLHAVGISWTALRRKEAHDNFRSSASRSAARAARAIAVSVGFFSTPVVKLLASATTTLSTA